MDKWQKVIELHHLFLKYRRPLTLSYLRDRLDCSEATVLRLRRFMVEKLGAPVIFDAKYRGYRYDLSNNDRFELPGLWLSVRETEALLGFHEAITALQSGFFSEVFAPVRKHLSRFMKSQHLHSSRDGPAVRIIPLHTRKVDETLFRTCADAAVGRKTLAVRHDKLDGSPPVERIVSPFAIVRYRDNWYLDAWCHLRGMLRTFSLDRMISAIPSSERFHPVAKKDCEAFYADAYGIFNGPAAHTAQISFTGVAATQVSREQWHPKQEGRHTTDGSYHLTLPYGDDRELVMDILKWGDLAKVISPPELRARVKSLLIKTLRNYEQ